MNHPLVSVVVPCMGQSQFLPEAVASIRAQTYPNLEIIVASGDEESTHAAEKLSPDVVLTGLNKGLGHARNEAIQISKGSLILPLDADDLLDKTFVERMVPFMDPPFAIASSRVREFGARKGTWNLSPWEGLLEQNALPACSLFTKALWQAVGGYDDAIIGYEDWAFWIACSELRPKVTQIHEYLFHYRVRPDSLFQWDQQNKADPYWRAMIRLRHPSLYPSPERRAQDRKTMADAPRPIRDKIEKRARDFPFNHALRCFVAMFAQAVPQAQESVYVPPPPKKPRIRPISAIVPCGPGHHVFLKECLESILGQTHKPQEILVACAENESLAVVESLAVARDFEKISKDIPLVAMKVPHLGAAAARNALIAKAQGEWIWNLDADDTANPTFLKKAANFAWQYEKPIVTADSEFFGQPHLASLERSAIGRSSCGQHRYPPVTALLTNCPVGSCALFSKALWEEVGGFPLLPGWEDWAFWIRCIKKHGAMVTQLHEHLHHYRIHENSVSEEIVQNKLEDWYFAFLRFTNQDIYGIPPEKDLLVLRKTPTHLRAKIEKMLRAFPDNVDLQLLSTVCTPILP